MLKFNNKTPERCQTVRLSVTNLHYHLVLERKKACEVKFKIVSAKYLSIALLEF